MLKPVLLLISLENITVPEEELLKGNTFAEVGGTINSDPVKNWKELLGFPSDEVVEKIIEATTQLCAEPIEMERREIPRQYQKTLMLPLHSRILRGRVDAGTMFATVKSILNYICVQRL